MTDGVAIALITVTGNVVIILVQTWWQERRRQDQTRRTLAVLPERVAAHVVDVSKLNSTPPPASGRSSVVTDGDRDTPDEPRDPFPSGGQT